MQMRGNIGAEIRHIEAAILTRENEGDQAAADWNGGFVCEVYLQIVARGEKLIFPALLKNLPILLKVLFIAPSRIRALRRES